MIRNDSDLTTSIELSSELLDGEQKSGITLVIKHDFYSANSIHGKLILGDFLSAICDNINSIDKVLIIDSGVKLLSADSNYYDYLLKIFKSVPMFMICSESLIEYNIDISDEFTTALHVSAYDIASEILNSPHVITIE